MKKEMFFSRVQLRQLRLEFGRIHTANPTGALFGSFRRYVNGLPEPMRAQLAANTIPWLSHIARGSFV